MGFLGQASRQIRVIHQWIDTRGERSVASFPIEFSLSSNSDPREVPPSCLEVLGDMALVIWLAAAYVAWPRDLCRHLVGSLILLVNL